MNSIKINREYIRKIEKFDPNFADLLKQAYSEFQKEIKASPIYYKTIRDALKNGDHYLARLPKDVLEKLKKGEYERIINNESGLWNGMIRRATDGKEIVKQTNWSEISLTNENLSNLNQLSLHANLAEISYQLHLIESKVDEILLGQHSNRVKIVQAGIELYEEAIKFNRKELQQQDLANAIQNLKTGKHQLIGEVENFFNLKKREDIFSDKLYSLIGVNKPELDLFCEIEKRENELLESIKFILIAYSFELRIRMFQNEFEAAEDTKNQLLAFIEKHISKNSELFKYLKNPIRENIQSVKRELEKLKPSLIGDSDLVLEFSQIDVDNENL